MEPISPYRSIAVSAYPAEELRSTTMSKSADELGYGRGADGVLDVPSYLSGSAPERPMRPNFIGDISCSS